MGSRRNEEEVQASLPRPTSCSLSSGTSKNLSWIRTNTSGSCRKGSAYRLRPVQSLSAAASKKLSHSFIWNLSLLKACSFLLSIVSAFCCPGSFPSCPVSINVGSMSTALHAIEASRSWRARFRVIPGAKLISLATAGCFSLLLLYGPDAPDGLHILPVHSCPWSLGDSSLCFPRKPPPSVLSSLSLSGKSIPTPRPGQPLPPLLPPYPPCTTVSSLGPESNHSPQTLASSAGSHWGAGSPKGPLFPPSSEQGTERHRAPGQTSSCPGMGMPVQSERVWVSLSEETRSSKREGRQGAQSRAG